MLLPNITKLFNTCNVGSLLGLLSSSKTFKSNVKTSGKYILNSPSKALEIHSIKLIIIT